MNLDDLRKIAEEATPGPWITGGELPGAEFDRWLVEVERAAAEKAWERGVNDVCAAYAIVRTRGYVENPYRKVLEEKKGGH